MPASARLAPDVDPGAIRCRFSRYRPLAAPIIAGDAEEVLMSSPSGPLPCGLDFTRRLDREPPPVVARLGWRFHHVGIPTTVPRPGETHLAAFGLFVQGFSASPYGVEWMRFAEDSSLPEIIRTIPHVAFEVDELDTALEGQTVIYPPGSPSDGVRSAMIVHNGAPIELICFRRAGGES